MDELQARHRKAQRDLQSRITQKKKNATKKTRKGVNDECDRLQRELDEQHHAEIDALQGNSVHDQFEALSIDDREAPSTDPTSDSGTEHVKQVRFDHESLKTNVPSEEEQSKPRKPNRQKARLARRAAEQEAQVAAAEEEAANQPNQREREMKAMKVEMDKLGMEESFIRPDGHCLYSACAMGLSGEERQSSDSDSQNYQSVRFATADYIAQHPDDFSAFLEEPLEIYVTKIRDTAEWGGHLELQAISRSYKVKVNVLRSDGRVERFSPSDDGQTNHEVWLAYYQHSFGLGEHYNLLHKIKT